MNRFPEKYEKPKLVSLDEGLNRGWSAACKPGNSASTVCDIGTGFSKGGDGFIDPEILRQGL
ncbi:MAG: hypothetical protein KAW14_08145 [Candidatus Aegiribacteria sp.]|nr:hypothetical protein [Candidatus Aegiribacteria sp.]